MHLESEKTVGGILKYYLACEALTHGVYNHPDSPIPCIYQRLPITLLSLLSLIKIHYVSLHKGYCGCTGTERTTCFVSVLLCVSTGYVHPLYQKFYWRDYWVLMEVYSLDLGLRTRLHRIVHAMQPSRTFWEIVETAGQSVM